VNTSLFQPISEIVSRTHGQGKPLVGRVGLVSPGVVALPEHPWGFTRGLLVQDPDGHVVQGIDT
jgi:hypothetical protein